MLRHVSSQCWTCHTDKHAPVVLRWLVLATYTQPLFTACFSCPTRPVLTPVHASCSLLHTQNFIIKVTTGRRRGAGTTDSVAIQLIGAYGTTQKFLLDTGDRGFERGSEERFTIPVTQDLGPLRCVRGVSGERLHYSFSWYATLQCHVMAVSVINVSAVKQPAQHQAHAATTQSGWLWQRGCQVTKTNSTLSLHLNQRSAVAISVALWC